MFLSSLLSQVAHAKIHSLETSVEGLLGSEGQLRRELRSLEQERTQLLDTVAALRAQLADRDPPRTQSPPKGPLANQDKHSPH